MRKINFTLICLLTASALLAQNVGINEPTPTNSLHISPTTPGDDPLRVDGLQTYTIGDTSLLIINTTTGVVKYINFSELSSIISPPDGDASPTNEIQTISEMGNVVTLSDNGGFIIDDDTQLTEAQVDAFVNNNGYLLTEVDGSVSNELQTITEVGNVVTLSDNGGSFVDDDTQLTEAQVDAFVNNNGYLLTEVDGSTTNELQTLTVANGTATLSGGGGSISLDDADSDPMNETNTSITLVGNTLSIADVGGTLSIDLTPVVDRASTPSGALFAFPTDTPPTGYLACEGQAVSRAAYADLFAVIGTNYGAGNGSTTFNLPDYRGQFLRGWNNGAGVDLDANSRTDRGDGTTGDVVGSKQVAQTRAHAHAVNPPSATTTANGTHAHTVNPPSTASTTTGAHVHSVDPPNTTSGNGGLHNHSVNPPATNTNTTGAHNHRPTFGNGFLCAGTSNGNNGSGYAGGGSPINWGGTGHSATTTTEGNHSHSVNIAAFNSANAGTHTHNTNIAAFNSASAGNHAHNVDIAPFSSSTIGNHQHTVDIPQFNSSNTGGSETRPTNVSVLWCIKH